MKPIEVSEAKELLIEHLSNEALKIIGNIGLVAMDAQRTSSATNGSPKFKKETIKWRELFEELVNEIN